MKTLESISGIEFDVVLTMGDNCRVAEALEDLGMKRASLPLDWCNSCPYSVYISIEEEFENYFNINSLQTIMDGIYLNADYGIQFVHEPLDLEAVRQKYRRRGRRFMNAIYSSGKRVLFLGQAVDRRGLIDPDNPLATRHARFCTEAFGEYQCSAAFFEEVYDLVRSKNPSLDFEMIVANYDVAKRNESDKVLYLTLPFVPFRERTSPALHPDREALKTLLGQLRIPRAVEVQI